MRMRARDLKRVQTRAGSRCTRRRKRLGHHRCACIRALDARSGVQARTLKETLMRTPGRDLRVRARRVRHTRLDLFEPRMRMRTRARVRTSTHSAQTCTDRWLTTCRCVCIYVILRAGRRTNADKPQTRLNHSELQMHMRTRVQRVFGRVYTVRKRARTDDSEPTNAHAYA